MDLQTWKAQAHARLRAWASELSTFTPGALFGALSAATLFPLVEAANQAIGKGNYAGLIALGSLAGSVGGADQPLEGSHGAGTGSRVRPTRHRCGFAQRAGSGAGDV